MNTQPQTPPNSDERLKKIQAAQEEMKTMTPSPEQIANEQLLELVSGVLKTSADTKSFLALAKTDIPKAVATLLREHLNTINTLQPASEQRIIDAVVSRFPTPPSNRDVCWIIHLWSMIIVMAVLLGFCFLIYLRA